MVPCYITMASCVTEIQLLVWPKQPRKLQLFLTPHNRPRGSWLLGAVKVHYLAFGNTVLETVTLRWPANAKQLWVCTSDKRALSKQHWDCYRWVTVVFITPIISFVYTLIKTPKEQWIVQGSFFLSRKRQNRSWGGRQPP